MIKDNTEFFGKNTVAFPVSDEGVDRDYEITRVWNVSSLLSDGVKFSATQKTGSQLLHLSNDLDEDSAEWRDFVKYLQEEQHQQQVLPTIPQEGSTVAMGPLAAFLDRQLREQPLFLSRLFESRAFRCLLLVEGTDNNQEKAELTDTDEAIKERLLLSLASLASSTGLSFAQSLSACEMIARCIVSPLSHHPTRAMLHALTMLVRQCAVAAVIDGLLVNVVACKPIGGVDSNSNRQLSKSTKQEREKEAVEMGRDYVYSFPQHDCVKEILVQALSDESRATFLAKLAHRNFLWSELTLALFQQLLFDLKLPLDSDIIGGVVRLLECNVQVFRENAKFCALILSLVCAHRVLLIPHKQTLIQVLDKTDTFITKKAKTKLLED